MMLSMLLLKGGVVLADAPKVHRNRTTNTKTHISTNTNTPHEATKVAGSRNSNSKTKDLKLNRTLYRLFPHRKSRETQNSD
jgi:hypothetical protein